MTVPDRRPLAPIEGVKGTIRVPGDKSISHRCLLFGAVAEGSSRIEGLAPGGDVRSTRGTLESLGVVFRDEGEALVVEGRGWSGLDRVGEDPPAVLDCGNSGTTARLLCGLLAGRKGQFNLIGDKSLSARPMGRVRAPLESFQARFRGGKTLPLTVIGSTLKGTTIQTEVASAQVKSALILGALQAEGESRISEIRPTRDHTERLLTSMNAPLERLPESGSAWKIGGGSCRLDPLEMTVPGDPSSAAYAVALGCLLPKSEVIVEGVSLNAKRLGFYRLIQRMGASISWECEREEPEPVGVIRARSGSLQGIQVDPKEVVDAIDEIPLLSVVAAAATGETIISGAEELRHKESDRIAATVLLLRSFGVKVEERPDGMVVQGGTRFKAASVDSHGDHRIAMCASVAAALADGLSSLAGHQWVSISYPGFYDDLARLASS